MRGRYGGKRFALFLAGLPMAVWLCCLIGDSNYARAAGPTRLAGVSVSYVSPGKAKYRPIFAEMRRLRVLERAGAAIDQVRLPRRLTYRLTECGGEPNAWYDPNTRRVTLCYEMVESIVGAAPRSRSPAGVTRREALLGPLALILLHESAHALFDILKVPVLGGEEKAADQIASIALLRLGGNEAKAIVDGSAYFFARTARQEVADKEALADVHELSWQRFYNLACLAYGSRAREFRQVVARGYLPRERAEGCEEEYEQVAFAFSKLIGPHLRSRPRRATRGRREWWRELPLLQPPCSRQCEEADRAVG